MTADFSELTKFADEIRKASTVAAAESRKVVTKAANNIKRDARANLRQQTSGVKSSLRRLPGAISYDISSGDNVTEAEVGPDQSISGLGVGTEFGSSHHPPMPFLHPAMAAEEPRFEAALTAALGKAFDL